MNLKSKIIWITGASSGIGEALAQACAHKGAILILSARNQDKLEALKQQLPNADAHQVIPIDLSMPDTIKEQIGAQFDEIPRIDILVNNAGIGQRGFAKETILDVQRKVMEVNYFGAVAMTQLVLPKMLAQGGGMIATVASVAGLVGGKSMAGYAASKHAIIGYMDCLRAEESDNGIQVLNICPGFVKTQISVNAFKGDGSQFNAMANSIANGISVAACATGIVKAIEQEKAQVILGKGISYWAPTIYRFFPSLFRRLSAKKNFRE
ncbi:SDR family oxidoreductase [Thalassotalea ganghwensis]